MLFVFIHDFKTQRRRYFKVMFVKKFSNVLAFLMAEKWEMRFTCCGAHDCKILAQEFWQINFVVIYRFWRSYLKWKKTKIVNDEISLQWMQKKKEKNAYLCVYILTALEYFLTNNTIVNVKMQFVSFRLFLSHFI